MSGPEGLPVRTWCNFNLDCIPPLIFHTISCFIFHILIHNPPIPALLSDGETGRLCVFVLLFTYYKIFFLQTWTAKLVPPSLISTIKFCTPQKIMKYIYMSAHIIYIDIIFNKAIVLNTERKLLQIYRLYINNYEAITHCSHNDRWNGNQIKWNSITKFNVLWIFKF